MQKYGVRLLKSDNFFQDQSYSTLQFECQYITERHSIELYMHIHYNLGTNLTNPPEIFLPKKYAKPEAPSF